MIKKDYKLLDLKNSKTYLTVSKHFELLEQGKRKDYKSHSQFKRFSSKSHISHLVAFLSFHKQRLCDLLNVFLSSSVSYRGVGSAGVCLTVP